MALVAACDRSNMDDMKRLLALAALVGLLAVSGAASADQNNPDLDDLFQKLSVTTEPAAAQPIERQIWMLWGLPDDRVASIPFAQGVIAMSNGALQEARGYFDQVVSVAPNFAEGWNKRATVAFYLGDMDGSVRDIQKTLELEPRHFGALSGLSMIYEAVGKVEAALDVLEQVKEIYPGMPGIDTRMLALRDALAKKKT